MRLNTLTGILTVAALGLGLTGCQNPDGTQNNTGGGMLLGGAMGALTGAAIGGSHHGGQDALIGAAAGAVAGGLIGNSMDREQAARLRSQSPQTYARLDQGQPISVADVKALAASGVNEEVILSQIKASRTIFHLNAGDIIDLHQSGVSDKVVNYMINTPSTVSAAPGPVLVQQAPPPYPVETVVVSPGPGYIWVGGEWVWRNGWLWVGGHWAYPPHPHGIWVGSRCWQGPHGWYFERGHWR